MPQKEVLSPAQVNWARLCTHINNWFYKPDFKALEVALSAVCAHYVIQGDPIWLFVIGPSSSGKTSIVINALEALPHTHTMGDLTPKTFISHYKGEDSGLLHSIGNSGIFLFKDFTTLLSKRDTDRAEIISQLREIYDGKWLKHTGVKGNPLWEGKVTSIAACTPEFEKHWAVHRALGDRFVQVKWRRVGGPMMARTATLQRGHEKEIKEKMQELTFKFCDRPLATPKPLSDALGNRLYNLAEMVCTLRAKVDRLSYGERTVMHKASGWEESPRIAKSLELIATVHASLWEREPTQEDLALAIRVGEDSVPDGRLEIFKHIPAEGTISKAELSRLIAMPESTVQWILEELQALAVIKMSSDAVGNSEVTITEGFRTFYREAYPALF